MNIPSQARWIGSDHPFDLHEVYLCFRSPVDWSIAHRPAQATLAISADSRYKLWVNGRFVGRGPARSWPDQQQVDYIDVTEHLHAGRNTIAVQVYQPGYSHFSYLHRGAAGLLCYLFCDGDRTLVSDASWRVRRDPSYSSLTPRVSIYGSGVEDRDLAQADAWVASEYDASGWAAGRVVAPAQGGLWPTLMERELPLLAERDLPLTLVEARRGACVAHSDAHATLRSAWFAAAVTECSVDEDGWLMATLGDGEASCWLFDLGRNYTCQGWVEVEGASGQETLLLSYAEKFRDGQLVISDPQTYCRVRMTDRFALRPGAQIAEGFSLRGGRYVLVVLLGPNADVVRLRCHCRVAEYPLAVSKPLPVSDPVLAQVVTMCETTLAACLQDGFVDCCWRESSQWLGDALPEALLMSSMSDDLRPLRQAIVMAAQGAYPDGVLPGVMPGEVHAYTVVDYNFTWVELLSIYLRLSSDRPFVAAHWPVLVRMLNRFDKDRGADGLLRSQVGRRLFLDWAPVSRAEPNAIYNLHYLLALQQAVALAEATGQGNGNAARLWRRRVQQLQAAQRSHFWQEGRWWDDLGRTTASQLAAALAILTGAAQPEEQPALCAAMVARSLDPDDAPGPGKLVLASPFMHHYLFEALRQAGQHQAVVEIIRLRWGRWALAGWPTTWENWNVDFPDGSVSHAFSAHPRYHLAEIARQGGRL